jgi:23S rRNA (uridine2552-2'-O)-methyltransferase
MARSKSSGRWLQEHFKDPFVIQSQKMGYRSRAVFKLKELDDKYRFLKPGASVVDLGAAPGAWSQYAVEKVGKKGKVVALDILPMDSLAGVTFIQGDFTESEPLEQLKETLAGEKVDVVLSDMAPNMSGLDAVDQPRSIYLVELAVAFAAEALGPGGVLVSKVFQGEGFDALISDLRKSYSRVIIRKPSASRPRSREVYLLASSPR